MSDWFKFALLALLSWGFWGFFPKLATNSLDPRSALVYEVIGVAIIGLLALILVGFKPEFHTKGVTFAILAGIAGSLGALFFLFAVSKGKASVIVPMTALYPLVTILLAFLILKEPITIKQGIGIILALSAVVLLSQ